MPIIDRIALDNLVGTKVNDVSLYQTAFVHKSASEKCNERLEFMGDSVLGLIVTKYLFTRYPDQNEGFLTRARVKIVSGKTLARAGRVLGLPQWIQMNEMAMSKGWTNNDNVLEDVFEALVGAVYLDIGMVHAREFVVRIISDPRVVDFNTIMIDTNYKDVLLRYCSQQKWPVPEFSAKQQRGDQGKWFEVRIIMNNQEYGYGQGRSKKEGEQAASLDALNFLQVPTHYIN